MAVMPNNYQRRISGSDRISELVSYDGHENAGRRRRIRDDWHFTHYGMNPLHPSKRSGEHEIMKRLKRLATDSDARPGMNAKIRVA